MENKPLEDPRKYLRICKVCRRNVYMPASDLVCEECQKVDREKLKADKDINKRVEDLYAQIGDKPDIQYPPGFVPGGNITYDGKEGKAKLTLPALAEIMKQIAGPQGPPPRAFTIPIELKVKDVPLTNTIWISPDIAAAIEEHMAEQKKKNKKDLNHEEHEEHEES